MVWDELRREYETTNLSLNKLALKYGVKYSSAKSRKQRQGWVKNTSILASMDAKIDALDADMDAEKPAATTAKRKKLSPGAPKGNQNAIGNTGGPGGPPGNKKALFTGEFEAIWMDCLSEEERELCSRINTDKLAQVEDAIRLISLREHRMMERIRETMGGLNEKQRKVLQERQVTKEAVFIKDPFTNESKSVIVSKPSLVVTSIEETERRKIDDVLRIEEALTRIQDKKAKLIALKHTLGASNKPGDNSGAEEHARRVQEAWAKRG